MVDEKLVQEVKNRDFLENVDYFDYFHYISLQGLHI